MKIKHTCVFLTDDDIMIVADTLTDALRIYKAAFNGLEPNSLSKMENHRCDEAIVALSESEPYDFEPLPNETL